MKRRFFCLLLMLLLLFISLPTTAETNEGGEGETTLPKGVYRIEELEEPPFNFSGVKETHVCWLDRAGKEKITVCRFEGEKDFAACRDRIRGYGLMTKDGLWYPDCDLPYTWFVHEGDRSIALYEGTDEDVRFAREGHCQLLKKYSPEGGYFLNFFLDLPRLPKGKSLEFLDEEGGLIVIMKPAMEYHKTMKELMAESDAVCIGRVTKLQNGPISGAASPRHAIIGSRRPGGMRLRCWRASRESTPNPSGSPDSSPAVSPKDIPICCSSSSRNGKTAASV